MLQELLLGAKKNLSDEPETIDIIRLVRSENVGPKTFIHLIKLFGSATVALEHAETMSIRGGRSKPIKLSSQSDAIKELEMLTKHKAGIITYNSPLYSKLLLEIPDFPPVLSYKGNIELLASKKTVAIVGARNASMNGRGFASRIAKELANHGCTIVSGLARGIDTAAHSVAINKTIAVVAGGIDYIYPPENLQLHNKISAEGLILAELPIGSKPLAQHFPQRNRLISGLSLGTVLVEAGLRSGSLITARYALEQNREVFAVPGFPLDPRSQGTNKLIKEGAQLVESFEDIINNLPNSDRLIDELAESNSKTDDFKLPSIEYISQIDDKMRSSVVEVLSATAIDFENLIQTVDLPLPMLYTIILELELAGKILRTPGNKLSLIY